MVELKVVGVSVRMTGWQPRSVMHWGGASVAAEAEAVTVVVVSTVSVVVTTASVVVEVVTVTLGNSLMAHTPAVTFSPSTSSSSI